MPRPCSCLRGHCSTGQQSSSLNPQQFFPWHTYDVMSLTGLTQQPRPSDSLLSAGWCGLPAHSCVHNADHECVWTTESVDGPAMSPWPFTTLSYMHAEDCSPSLHPHSSLQITDAPSLGERIPNMENVANLWIQISARPSAPPCLICGSLAQSLWASTLRTGVGSPQQEVLGGQTLHQLPRSSPATRAVHAAKQTGAGCEPFLTKCTSSGLWGQGEGRELHLHILCPTRGAAQHNFSFICCSSSTLVSCIQGRWLESQLLATESGMVVPLPSPPASWWQSYTTFSRHQAHLFIQPAHSLQEAGTVISPFYK